MSRARTVAMLVVVALLAACAPLREQAPGQVQIRAARIAAGAAGAVLQVELDCHLSGPMRGALEHGIPLTLLVHLRAGPARPRFAHAAVQRRVELLYFPLSRRYQLRDVEGGSVRSFATPGYLIDALSSLHLAVPDAFASLPSGTRLSVDVTLDRRALPGPLLLPAVFEPAWRFVGPEYAWTTAAG